MEEDTCYYKSDSTTFDDEVLCEAVDQEASNTCKISFSRKYFRQIAAEGNSKRSVCECVICNAHCVPNNFARHLASHNIVKECRDNNIRGRQCRSFVWKYCTKEDLNHARCHLCQKLLYFGGGNTSNITKHLRRMHHNIFAKEVNSMRETDSEETASATASIVKREMSNGTLATHATEDALTPQGGESSDNAANSSSRKERKGMSYVWKYCEKLSRHSIRCNLCNKTMSFHGTANVITHLQRRHNILGKIDNEHNDGALDNESPSSIQLDLNAVIEPQDDENCDQQIEDFVNSIKRRKRSAGSISVVWKYCTRIGRDAVRCKFCKKNLSYQGTSNLQRHLHRMHGVVTRGPKDSGDNDEQAEILNTDFIWEYCTVYSNGHAKCNMCTNEFNVKQPENFAKHLTVVHAVNQSSKSVQRGPKMQLNMDSAEHSSGDEYENWSEVNAKKDDSFYNEIIEEEHDVNYNNEDPFNESVIHEETNPLSPQSSNSDLREPIMPTFQNNVRLQELNEERLRTETEYFREKAGYYRMQKYLTALQAKKVNIEIERMQSNNSNFNGTFATITLDGIQQNIPT